MAASLTIEERSLISDLLTEFCRRVDGQSGGSVAELFTEDARIETPHFEAAGRDAIAAWFAGRAGTKRSRHCWTNLHARRLGPARFEVTTNMITMAGALPAPEQAARIAFTSSTDEVITADGQALFARRTLEILFELPAAAPEPA